MRHFLLMSTSGCHLCDEAVELLVTGLDPQRHSVDEVDIAFDDALMERFGVRIPVLVDEASGAELGWPFDAQGLQRFVASLE
ncbi:thioredoxin family protein [Marinobacterium nitratireducens]|uniref:Thioredoxin family protein n=1 Tax=Marinobacterium nitratireducens TaxID=518897 RepID=A0A918DNR2_9GAMM|nr:glutaredoxin family protein [Marinobacterium nitratireducens]GGO75844.1 thioredoxin family protein [Marinobacterium nitratireducens]